MMRLCDQNTHIHPHDTARLAKNDLDDSRIPPVRRCPLAGERRRLHVVESNDGGLRLRDDLLRHDEDVAALNATSRDTARPDDVHDRPGEIVVRFDVRKARYREDMEIHRQPD